MEFAQKALRRRIESFYELPWVKSIKLCLGGDSNFRKDIFPEYKSQRPPKPLRFKEVKRLFIEEFQDIMKISDNCEADDDVSVMGWWGWNVEKYHKSVDSGWENPVVMCHIDKDGDQVPGLHYDFDKNNLYEINEFTAHYNLAVQCIIGDKTDGILSVPKANVCVQERYAIGKGNIGPAKAKKILRGCESVESLYKEVEELYKCYYKEDYKSPLNLTYKLVHLLEKKDEIKDFPFQE